MVYVPKKFNYLGIDETTLNIGKSSSPTGTSNISIGSNERAVISPSNITITSV